MLDIFWWESLGLQLFHLSREHFGLLQIVNEVQTIRLLDTNGYRFFASKCRAMVKRRRKYAASLEESR